MVKQINIKWLPQPEDKNFPAAESYLGLLYNDTTVKSIVSNLKSGPLSQFKAKLFFYSSCLNLVAEAL